MAAASDCLSAAAGGCAGFHRLLNNGGQTGHKPPDCIVYETQQAEMQGCYAFKGNKKAVVIYEVLTQSFHNFAAIQGSDDQVQKQGDVDRETRICVMHYGKSEIIILKSKISGVGSNYILMP